MQFSSLYFIFIFLPIILLFYYIIPNKYYRNILLTAVSFFLYTYAIPSLAIYLVVYALLSYVAGLLIQFYLDQKKAFFVNFILWICILIMIGGLFFFKYTPFIQGVALSFFKLDINLSKIIAPIGISFYSFEIISYLVDIKTAKIKAEKNPINYFLYLSFFANVTSGPILRYRDMKIQIENREHSLENINYGLRRFVIGLSKKVILANEIGACVANVFAQDLTTMPYWLLWIGLWGYTIQLYLDFSGYSDMALGIGSMFGFEFPENFKTPYLSTSVSEFFRRWHITLGSWFKDYIYIPLGGNRKGIFRQVLNIMIVWLLTGIWHGSSWNFFVWGIYLGIVITLEKLLLHRLFQKVKFIGWLFTMVCIIFGWLLFRCESLTQVQQYISCMFQITDVFDPKLIFDYNVMYYIPFILIGTLVSFVPIPYQKIHERKLKLTEAIGLNLLDFVIIILLIISICLMVNKTYTPFLYYRF